uniref:Nascent polypeptide-associated complex subunit alpha-like UBA domain-containing protein n=1 Tax=viral metagenome TaxID=1070528 RepID=A0A6C0EDX6_9ZZZZ
MDSITISLTNNLDKSETDVKDLEKNNENIDIVLRQTNYTKEVAIQKLKEHNNNTINVIKEYMGVKPTEKKAPIKSLNQEIYRQIRIKLDTSMDEYRAKQDGKITII